MGDLVAATGAWGKVVWATDDSGESSAHAFFAKLNDRDSARADALFQRLATFGEIRNTERFKKLDDVDGWALFEFKLYQLRFIGAFRAGGIFVIAHALRKKQNDHRPRDLKTAARILEDYATRSDADEKAR